MEVKHKHCFPSMLLLHFFLLHFNCYTIVSLPFYKLYFLTEVHSTFLESLYIWGYKKGNNIDKELVKEESAITSHRGTKLPRKQNCTTQLPYCFL